MNRLPILPIAAPIAAGLDDNNKDSLNEIPDDCKKIVVAFLDKAGILAFRVVAKETRGLCVDRFVQKKAEIATNRLVSLFGIGSDPDHQKVQALIDAGADVTERVTHLNGSQQSLKEVAIASRFPQAIIDVFLLRSFFDIYRLFLQGLLF